MRNGLRVKTYFIGFTRSSLLRIRPAPSHHLFPLRPLRRYQGSDDAHAGATRAPARYALESATSGVHGADPIIPTRPDGEPQAQAGHIQCGDDREDGAPCLRHRRLCGDVDDELGEPGEQNRHEAEAARHPYAADERKVGEEAVGLCAGEECGNSWNSCEGGPGRGVLRPMVRV